MPRKKVVREYFTKDTENAILEYNTASEKEIRDRIYKERIQQSFEKLAEIVYNKWKRKSICTMTLIKERRIVTLQL
jgi:hypothetical protein